MRQCRAYIYPEKSEEPKYALLVLETDYFLFDEIIATKPRRLGADYIITRIDPRQVKRHIIENYTKLLKNMVAKYLVR